MGHYSINVLINFLLGPETSHYNGGWHKVLEYSGLEGSSKFMNVPANRGLDEVPACIKLPEKAKSSHWDAGIHVRLFLHSQVQDAYI